MWARVRALILLELGLAMAAAGAVELKVPPHRQDIPAWGWAAAAAMVVEFLNGWVTQDCQVLVAYDRLLGGPGSCCEDPMACMRPGVSQEIVYVLESVYGLPGRHLPRALTFAEIAGEIDAGRPVIAALRKADVDHVVVITGYEGSGRVILVDPLRGKTRVPYAQVRENKVLGTWSGSAIFSASPQKPRAPPRPEAELLPKPRVAAAAGAAEPQSIPSAEDSAPLMKAAPDLPPASQLLFPVEPVCILC